MSVDLSKVSQAKADFGSKQLDKNTAHNLQPGDQNLSVLDRVSLRKSWAKKGNASYWVDILSNSQTGQYQVFRSWRWFNKNTSEVIEGHTWCGRITNHRFEVADTFVQFVKAQLTQNGYVEDERQASLRSPAINTTFSLPTAEPPKHPNARCTIDEEAPKPEKPIMQRQAEKDWW